MSLIPIPDQITFNFCIKEGVALNDVRGQITGGEFIFKMEDGYNVFLALLENQVSREAQEYIWDKLIYFRMRKTQRQKDFSLLTVDNFFDSVAKSFSLKSNQNGNGGFKVYIFIYVKKSRESRNSSQSIRRAGHVRVQAEVERIRQFREDNPGNDDIGDIATAQWSQNLARQEPVPLLERPVNQAFQQAVRIDQMPSALDDNFVRIDIKFSEMGSTIPIWFNSSHLRLAFNLPPGGTLHDYLQNNHGQHGDDQDDVDHCPDEFEH
jgi:hypothetical protein